MFSTEQFERKKCIGREDEEKMDSRPRFHGDDILRGNDRRAGALRESRRTGEQVNRGKSKKKEDGFPSPFSRG